MSAPLQSNALLLAFCGLPGAGKTTLAESLVSSASGDGCSSDARPRLAARTAVEHVSFDDAYASEATAFDPASSEALAWSPELWRVSRAHAIQSVREALLTHTTSSRLKAGSGDDDGGICRLVVLVDDNLYLRSMRKALYRVAQEVGAAFRLVHIHLPMEEALRRNALRPTSGLRRVKDEVIERMASRLEAPCVAPAAPTSSHYAATVEPSLTTCIDTAGSCGGVDTSLAALLSVINDDRTWVKTDPLPSLVDAEKAKAAAAARAATAASRLHSADLSLRQCVKATVQARGPAAAKAANEARAKALAELRDTLHSYTNIRGDSDDDDEVDGSDGHGDDNGTPGGSALDHLVRRAFNKHLAKALPAAAEAGPA